MGFATNMQLNKLGYDRGRGVVEFSMRKSLDNTAIVISGEVPMVVIDSAHIRSASKAAVRQALLDAADALERSDDEDRVKFDTEAGIRPEDLNATNDD